MRDVRLAAPGASDEETRGDAAERAVAPLTMAGGGEADGGVRRADGGVALAVAIGFAKKRRMVYVYF